MAVTGEPVLDRLRALDLRGVFANAVLGGVAALTDYSYLLTALGGAALTFLIRVEGRFWKWVWPVIDALALGCWAAAGAQKTLDLGLGWLPAVLLGTITAVGGGAVRDIVLRRVPGILDPGGRRNHPEAVSEL